MSTCWHNGEFKPLTEVHVSVFDFGFIHGDATYDVLRVREGRPRFLEKHLKRFAESCAYYGFPPLAEAESILSTLVARNSIPEAFAWLCVWRGTPPSGSPRDPNAPQNALIYLKPYYGLNSASAEITLTIEREHRRVPSACYDQKYKNFGWIELNFAQRFAAQKGFDSALTLGIEGFLSEGPGFGVCFVRDGQILTPARDCLQSVTIEVIEEICRAEGIRFARTDISAHDALSCEEAFVCSTSGGITPVTRIDNKTYRHDLTRRLMELYDRR